MEKRRHNLYDVSSLVMLLVRFLKAQTMSEYVCPAHVGEPDYTQHDLYGDGIHINSSSFISFQVKCKGNAFILLHQQRKEFTSYAVELRIGVANSSHIGVLMFNKQKKFYMNCPARNIVSEWEYRYFWIRWAEHVLNIGSGSIPGTQEINCTEKITFDINYISIGTAYKTAAYWKFEKSQLTRSPIGRTLTLSTAQNIKPSNATPQSTCSSTTVTQNLSTSQNVKPYTEKSQTTPSPTGMTQTLSTSQNITPSNEEDEDTDKDTVYIMVVDVVTLLVVITAIVLLVYKKKRNRRRKQTGLDLVYNGNSTQTTNAPEGPGIEETHIFITQASDTLQNARDATSSNDTETQLAHSTQIIMEGKQLQGVTPNLFERLNVDKGVKTEDKYTKSHLVPRAEAYHDTYSRVSLNHSQYKSMLDTEKTDQSKQNTSNTNGHSDAFTEGEEDQSSLYDHAITGNIRTRRGNISEYSHLKDID